VHGDVPLCIVGRTSSLSQVAGSFFKNSVRELAKPNLR
jgi:hypothetical protein